MKTLLYINLSDFDTTASSGWGYYVGSVISLLRKLFVYTKDTYVLVYTMCTRIILKYFANLRKIFDI